MLNIMLYVLPSVFRATNDLHLLLLNDANFVVVFFLFEKMKLEEGLEDMTHWIHRCASSTMPGGHLEHRPAQARRSASRIPSRRDVAYWIESSESKASVLKGCTQLAQALSEHNVEGCSPLLGKMKVHMQIPHEHDVIINFLSTPLLLIHLYISLKTHYTAFY
jgi:hypothetical protein